MAIVALHLHIAGSCSQIFFQVHPVAELDRARVGLLRAQRREFRMAGVEAIDLSGDMQGPAFGFQIAMASGACFVAGLRKTSDSLVFEMTFGASGLEGLLLLVSWAVMTGAASLVRHCFSKTGIDHVA